ncbi:hypothetical protein GTY40_14435 [Streptomyces sp. SID8359]|uniref:hypothetical protein n=1 Tax=unclassified Streptomyces TaxID=2593676 RepID=UPI00048C2FE5|nr:MULTISPECIES: hypothetical protein [unclassified Streptomyces]MYT92226.1 hypothetical protein [Streptomyces sp. SID8359]
MRRSRDAALRRARVAALIASAVTTAAVAVSGCSGGGPDGGGAAGSSGNFVARAPGVHRWTGTPCAPLTGEPLAKGFDIGSATDSADPGVREDIGEGGDRPRYRQTGCLAGLTGPDGAPWRLYTSAAVYEESAPAHRAYRTRHDLDRAHGRGPERVHRTAYAKPVHDQGHPGRALLLWNGDLLLTVTAYGPYGSKARDVREGLQGLVENTARLMEDALRDGDARSPVPSVP